MSVKAIIDLRRRSAIEAEIGAMITDHRLSRCPMKGAIGDAVFAILNACSRILAHLWAWLVCIIAVLRTAESAPNRCYLNADVARKNQ
ncbi:hypothetical protein HYN69_02805 [Gemmobacter aquarius]|uniref:Transposase DDE domain-containing protein n=1 Tax=Paragemmobacter aquarius TaxID=2169400 RepID=A0A2S0UIB6_9RHOB|nr:hypothetical protein HYN69_02805 [Gemmobacter aquarius]